MLAKLNLRAAKAFIALAATLLVAAQCGSASLSFSGDTGDFRNVAVGVPQSHTLKIVNSGNEAAVLGAIGDEALGLAAPFSVTGGTCVSGGTVAPNGGSCTLILTFSPTAAGVFSDRLTVKYNWADSGVADQIVRFDVGGIANDSVVVDHCDPNNAYLAFGTRPIGSSSAVTFTFRNFAPQPAIFEPLLSTPSIGLAAPFSLTGGSCLGGEIAPLGGTCTLDVTFTPTAAVTSRDNVEVTYRFAGQSVRQQAGSCRVEGTGAAPIAIGGGPAFAYRELSLGASALKTFVVTNWHDEPAQLSPMTSEGLGLAAPFRLAQSSCTDSVIAAKGGQCTLQVAFSPSQLGAASDRLEVGYRLPSGAAAGTLSIDLSGAGVAPDPVADVTAGTGHTCVLLASGAVRCWGSGFFGVLGYGNTDDIGDDESPSTAGNVDVGGRVVQIVAGDRHTCALLAGGNVRCWGSDGARPGVLGYGRSESLRAVGDDETPASVGDVNVGGRVVKLAAGDAHTCAVLDTGAVRCWGSGSSGSLGYGNTQSIGDNEHPAAAGDVNVGGSVTQIDAGSMHTCALLSTNRVRCWGYGYAGLGYGNTSTIGDDELPFTAGDLDLGGTATHVSAGLAHTCARLSDGAVRCWGLGPGLLFDNTPYGSALGYGHANSIGDDEAPASAGDVNVGGPVAQVEAGTFRTCAVLATGSVRCWGRAAPYSLGYGNLNTIGDNETPAAAGDIALGAPATQVRVGGWHMCARVSSGQVRCWGYNRFGELGYAHTRVIGDDELPATAGDVTVQ